MSSTAHLVPTMSDKLEVLRATSDRADPLDEAVLCLVEAAALAVDVAERARTGTDPTALYSCVREVLGAARAAVTAATFAVVQVKDDIVLSRVAPPDTRL